MIRKGAPVLGEWVPFASVEWTTSRGVIREGVLRMDLFEAEVMMDRKMMLMRKLGCWGFL